MALSDIGLVGNICVDENHREDKGIINPIPLSSNDSQMIPRVHAHGNSHLGKTNIQYLHVTHFIKHSHGSGVNIIGDEAIGSTPSLCEG